ncbi:MAG: RHS repeat-associated core domain-containing protein [Acidobacteriota bacterium]|nr:RHS repeat-associated core domain-containing protein [Acidobacteriota bacterium]
MHWKQPLPDPSRLARRATLLLSLLLWALPVLWTLPAAAEFPSQESGYSQNATFALSGVDDVNLFNGNLLLNLPLGQAYPAGGGLSYGFSLRYNSNRAWEPRESPHICIREFMGDDVDVPIDIFDPQPTNAGPGWEVAFGELEGPSGAPSPGVRWKYLSPDGAEREFFPNLHPPATAYGNAHYTVDGTFLRLQSEPAGCLNLAAGQRTGCTMLLEMPDGTVHRFEDADGGGETWRITRIESPSPLINAVDFTYLPDEWQISDGWRTHKVFFTDGRISSIEVAVFNGLRETYDFEYTNHTVRRHRFDFDWYQARCIDGTAPDDPEYLTVPLLTRVVQPDDSYYEMDYYTEDLFHGGDGMAAGIQTLRLWTGLHYEWKYAITNFRYQQGPAHLQPRAASLAYGVTSKEVYGFTPSGGPRVDYGTWQYLLDRASVQAPGDLQPPNNTSLEPCYHQATVIDPLGNYQVHYLLTADLGFEYQQNRPYTVCDPQTGAFQGDPNTGEPGPGPFLSQEIFDASGTKLREVWVDYESDGVGSGSPFHHEQRMTYRATVFLDDGGRVQEVAYSDFDGLGNARLKVEDGDFPLGRNRRETFTSFNSGRAYADPPPPASAPWVLGLYDQMEVIEGDGSEGHSARTLFCFEDATGFLQGTRSLKANAPGTGDVVRRYQRDSRGQTTSETVYGGDGQSLADATCAAGAVAGRNPVYETRHSYQYGSLKKSEVMDGSAVVLVQQDQDIDQNTGLPSHRRDASGVETTLHFDPVGRLSRELRQGSFATQHRYFYPQVGQDPNASLQHEVRQCAEGEQTCPGAPEQLTRRLQRYDRLGRLSYEERRVPESSGLTTRSRQWVYNDLGWLLKSTVWGDASQFIEYRLHDAFGRPGEVVQPDGSTRTLGYTGERVRSEAVQVASETGLVTRTVTQHFDARGRLVKVVEPSGPSGGDVATTYEYDEGNRLIRACVDDGDGTPGNGCSGQERLFDYDDRGFLVQERNPEIGCAGNGTLDYTYDPRGNALSRTYSMAGCAAGAADLSATFRYDPAGRLTQMRDAQGQLLKELFYARHNVGADLRKGKLVQTKRHNVVPVFAVDPWLDPEDIVITETYAYAGRGGRVSSYSVRGSRGNQDPSFTLEITGYDDLGNVTGLRYPDCQHSPCAGEGGRTLSFGYAEDYLTSISGYLSSVNYHPTGLLDTLTHANGVADEHDLDPADGARLGSLAITGVADGEDWSSGTFAYDPAGNITALGSESFAYDRGLRLTRGTFWADRGKTDSRTQELSYDVFGNLTEMETTDDGVRPIGVSSTTNRITSHSASYDVAGNAATLWGGYAYTFDAAGRMLFLDGGPGLRRSYLYTAGDERVAVLDLNASTQSWTVRGVSSQVLSRFEGPFGALADPIEWQKDYVRAGSRAVARVTDQGTEHLHLDHLGSTRMITGGAGGNELVAFLSYYPFGQNTADPVPGDESFQFTGHERDDNGGGLVGDLDYMHARYYHPMFGKFLSIDPVDADPRRPQSWNAYRYASNRPLTRVDPDGKDDLDWKYYMSEEEIQATYRAQQETMARLRIEDPERYRQIRRLEKTIGAGLIVSLTLPASVAIGGAVGGTAGAATLLEAAAVGLVSGGILGAIKGDDGDHFVGAVQGAAAGSASGLIPGKNPFMDLLRSVTAGLFGFLINDPPEQITAEIRAVGNDIYRITGSDGSAIIVQGAELREEIRKAEEARNAAQDGGDDDPYEPDDH